MRAEASMATTRSTCPYCGVGCGVIIEHDAERIIGIQGDPEHPANFGRLCSKGSSLHLTAAPHVTAQARLLQPMRRAARHEPLTPVGWDDAFDEAARRLAGIVQEHGPDSVGLYLSGQLLTEDYYAFNKLGKGLVGTNNVDTNSRLCMSSAVAGHRAAFGSDLVPGCYEDLSFAQTVFITGSNMAWAHPVLYRRLEEARRARPSMKLIVVDPRRTETATDADLHLQLQPGTDVVLFHSMLHVMLWEQLTDSEYIARHTTGFAALRDRVREFTPAHAAKVCGVRADDIVQAARWFANLQDDGTRAPTLSLWCQGLNQSSSGTDKVTSLINLHLALGQIGKPGAGPFSLTGQPNAMGGREVGGLANLLSAHRDLGNAEHRAEVAALWGVNDVPAAPGKTAVDMFRAAADGEIRALWIVCTNPAHSMPDQTLVRKALQRCEFVIVQDAFATTATADFADLLLPAASWGEKEGTVTNSERRISRVRAAVQPAGQARPDWDIATQVGRRMEAFLPSRRVSGSAETSLFDWRCAQDIWMEHRETTRGRDLDITGLTWEALDTPQQWPRPDGAAASTARLFESGDFPTPDGRARFHAPAWKAVAESPDAHYPFALTTGRLRDQWHGMSRTGTLGRLFGHASGPVVQMHPQDLQRRRLRDGELVKVRSRRGSTILPLQASDTLAPAQTFVAMHWGPEFLGGAGLTGINALMPAAYCPQSRQPELKHAAVRIESARMDWHLSAAAWLDSSDALRVRDHLRRWGAQCDFFSCVHFGREPDASVGVWLQAACTQAPDVAVWREVLDVLQMDQPATLRYEDVRQGRSRHIRLAHNGSLAAFVLVGDARAPDWMLDSLKAQSSVAQWGRALLAAPDRPPHDAPARSPQVCGCHDVSEDDILQVLRSVEGGESRRLEALQQTLRCGTECGSCLPAVRALVRRPTLSTQVR